MARQVIDLGEQAFILINGPLVFFNLTANIFYACCLIFPPCNRQRLKQPLKAILGILVWCSTTYCVALPLLYWVRVRRMSFEMLIVPWMIVLFFMHNSMTCSVWLNFYYYIHIVPSRRALLIWLKRNIRSVIYVAILQDWTLFLFTSAVAVADAIFQTSSGFRDTNDTWTLHLADEVNFTTKVFFVLIRVHILICLGIMMVSSVSTVHYLLRNIRSVAQLGCRLSTPRIQSQMRVTMTGISQAVLYFLFDTFYLFDSFTSVFSPCFFISHWVSFTVTSLYITGTTLNLGIGQAAFRQRASNVWKALKALRGVVMETNDVKCTPAS